VKSSSIHLPVCVMRRPRFLGCFCFETRVTAVSVCNTGSQIVSLNSFAYVMEE
jgi:hypothetical protein